MTEDLGFPAGIKFTYGASKDIIFKENAEVCYIFLNISICYYKKGQVCSNVGSNVKRRHEILLRLSTLRYNKRARNHKTT